MDSESMQSVAAGGAAPHALEPTSGPLTFEELQLAGRNRGMPLEALRYATTPTGLHYLLVHWDIPDLEAEAWRLRVDGLVRRPLELTLAGLSARPALTLRVTMECAGNGRARLDPRPVSQPWLNEAIGTAEWTGTPLAPILEEAGIADEAHEIVFTGADRGIQGGIEQDYGRSLPIADAMRPEVLIATAMNGQPLQPQHGQPARLLVPGWYGMASVKWLTSIRAVAEPFTGFQQTPAYRYQRDADDPGEPVTRIRVRALMIPPGIPTSSRAAASSNGARSACSGEPGRAMHRSSASRWGRRPMARCDARPGRRAVRLARLVLRLGGDAGRPRAGVPGHGCVGERPACNAAVELPGDGQQPHPGGGRQRAVARAGPTAPPTAPGAPVSRRAGSGGRRSP